MKAVWLICITAFLITTEILVYDWIKFAVQVDLTTRTLRAIEPAPTPTHTPSFQNL